MQLLRVSAHGTARIPVFVQGWPSPTPPHRWLRGLLSSEKGPEFGVCPFSLALSPPLASCCSSALHLIKVKEDGLPRGRRMERAVCWNGRLQARRAWQTDSSSSLLVEAFKLFGSCSAGRSSYHSCDAGNVSPSAALPLTGDPSGVRSPSIVPFESTFIPWQPSWAGREMAPGWLYHHLARETCCCTS